MQRTVYTIGHSTHPRNEFFDLLSEHGITALCDVRSVPYSRLHPYFNRKELKAALQKRQVAYAFLGSELGARSEDPSCYDHGRVQYGRLARMELFQQGLARVQNGMKKFRLVLMCAEKEPLECHRAILVARHLVALSIDVQHIHETAAWKATTWPWPAWRNCFTCRKRTCSTRAKICWTMFTVARKSVSRPTNAPATTVEARVTG